MNCFVIYLVPKQNVANPSKQSTLLTVSVNFETELNIPFKNYTTQNLISFKAFLSLRQDVFIHKANETAILAPQGLSLNLGQARRVLHCAVWKIIH